MAASPKTIDLSLEAALGIAACSCLLTLVFLGFLNPGLLEIESDQHDMSYTDLVVIILTALAVMLAVLALLATVLAVFGIGYFKKKLIDAAEAKAAEVAKPAAERVADRRVSERFALRDVGNEPEDYAGATAQADGGIENEP